MNRASAHLTEFDWIAEAYLEPHIKKASGSPPPWGFVNFVKCQVG